MTAASPIRDRATPPGGAPPARRHRRRRLLAGAAVLAFLAGLAAAGTAAWRWNTDPTCQATAGGTSLAFSPEQTHNAATIASVALGRGLPARAITIALATALQESDLRNIDYGDRDSVGLFQQRPSQGWGTVEEILDPVYSAGAFFDALVKVDDYESRPITEVAQEVQRSAYPTAYADHEQQGRVLASTLAGHSPAGLACRLGGPGGAGSAAQLRDDLESRLGAAGSIENGRLVVPAESERTAWSVAAWAVAQAAERQITAVDLADRSWRRDGDRGGLDWATTSGDPGGTVVTITLE